MEVSEWISMCVVTRIYVCTSEMLLRESQVVQWRIYIYIYMEVRKDFGIILPHPHERWGRKYIYNIYIYIWRWGRIYIYSSSPLWEVRKNIYINIYIYLAPWACGGGAVHFLHSLVRGEQIYIWRWGRICAYFFLTLIKGEEKLYIFVVSPSGNVYVFDTQGPKVNDWVNACIMY